jgi:hypothetical protein
MMGSGIAHSRTCRLGTVSASALRTVDLDQFVIAYMRNPVMQGAWELVANWFAFACAGGSRDQLRPRRALEQMWPG